MQDVTLEEVQSRGWLNVVIIMLSVVLALGLFRAYSIEADKEALVIEKTDLPSTPASGTFIASKKGTRYYFPWCKNTILPANKITFASREEAERAGYKPAVNCPGL